MKKLLLLLALVPLWSCSEEEEKSVNPFNGDWDMTSYSAYMDSNPVWETGDIIWKINNGNLTVENHVEADYPYLLQSGFYPVEQNDATLTISTATGDAEWDAVIVNDNELILSDSPETDGPMIHFERR